MQSMNEEQVRVMVSSHLKKIEENLLTGKVSALGEIKPSIIKMQSGKYAVMFDTPIGDVKLKSARQDTRTFASIDSAMKTINHCGLNFAHVHSA